MGDSLLCNLQIMKSSNMGGRGEEGIIPVWLISHVVFINVAVHENSLPARARGKHSPNIYIHEEILGGMRSRIRGGGRPYTLRIRDTKQVCSLKLNFICRFIGCQGYFLPVRRNNCLGCHVELRIPKRAILTMANTVAGFPVVSSICSAYV
ncbi:hypothetical protein POVCU2_0024730 [Plasmodium ovale curtisi]|uniref:Uncharacterized protein n=1 Tax=Plasmodium ovale curtisi TaxID=864141 RepID=A0A1A8VXS7_PLAOA|nr:hypothetical protein POVCU2_0024730 [Plasmodium ovale curtisi]